MIRVNRQLCARCGGCVGVCPVLALALTEHGISCNERCTNCRICINFCPVDALRLEGDER